MSAPFENAPEMGQKFKKAQTPEKLEHDPPRKVWDEDRVLEPTPLGTIEVDVLPELDHSTQRAIHQARTEPDEFEQRMLQRFNHARHHGRGPSKSR